MIQIPSDGWMFFFRRGDFHTVGGWKASQTPINSKWEFGMPSVSSRVGRYGCQPKKSGVFGCPPNHQFFWGVFHDFHHPFWGDIYPYFWFNTPYRLVPRWICCSLNDFACSCQGYSIQTSHPKLRDLPCEVWWGVWVDLIFLAIY